MMKRTTTWRLAVCAMVAILAAGLSINTTPAMATAGRTENATITGLSPDTWAGHDADGDLLVIGDPNAPTSAGAGAGVVHVYRWSGFAWVVEDTLEASDAEAWAGFGGNVAVDGDTIVVSKAIGASGGAPGTAYVFTHDASSWTETSLVESPVGYEEYFGFEVAVSGDRIAVSALYQPWPIEGPGAIFTYALNGGVASYEGTIGAPPGDNNWGISLDLDGDTLVTTLMEDHGDPLGAVHIFDWSGTDWVEKAVFPGRTQGPMGWDWLTEVAISGDIVVGGAPCHHCDHGKAYVYERSGGVWAEVATLTASDHAVFDTFGSSVDLVGDTIVIAAPGVDENRGAAYVFEASGANWVETQKLVASDAEVDDYFGAPAIADESIVLVGQQDKAYVYFSAIDSGVARLAGVDRSAPAAAGS